MTDEVYDYQQSQKMRAQAAHRTPISPPRMPSEAENHLKDGVCKTLVLPNLPSVAGRVKYAMGAMNVGQFSQRTGISISYLSQLCNGKAKTLSAFNARRIAGASEMGVTIGWLMGISKPEEKTQAKEKATLPSKPELPDITDFWERLEWAVKNSGKSRNAISYEIGANTDYISYSIRNKSKIRHDMADPLAKALGVDKAWLFRASDVYEKKAPEKKMTNGHNDLLMQSVKDEMLAIGMSYTEMAAQIGVSYSSLYKWLNGDNVPSDDNVKKIQCYLENKSPSAIATKDAHEDVQKMQKPVEKREKIVQRFEGVYAAETLAAIVSVLKGTYKVSLTLEEV